MDETLKYLERLKDRVYYLLILKEREVGGENVHFSLCATTTSQRMIGALHRFPELDQQDAYSDAIDAVTFFAGENVSLQHVRTHVLNIVNDIDRIIGKLRVAKHD